MSETKCRSDFSPRLSPACIIYLTLSYCACKINVSIHLCHFQSSDTSLRASPLPRADGHLPIPVSALTTQGRFSLLSSHHTSYFFSLLPPPPGSTSEYLLFFYPSQMVEDSVSPALPRSLFPLGTGGAEGLFGEGETMVVGRWSDGAPRQPPDV